MKKILFAIATMAMLFSAAPVFAQECENPIAPIIEQAKAMQLGVLSLKGANLEAFKAAAKESGLGEPPVDEYDELVINYRAGDAFRIIVVNQGCAIMASRNLPFYLLQKLIKEAHIQNDEIENG